MVKLFNIGLMISLILISLYIYADDRILSGLIKKSSLSEKMIKSSSITSLLTLGEMYQKGLGVEKDLLKAQKYYRVAMNYVNSSEDFSILHNTDNLTENLTDYEEQEVSEIHHDSSLDSTSTSENTNFIEKSESEKDIDNINDLIFEQRRISVLKESQIEFENNLEIYKKNLQIKDETVMSLAMNDGIYNDNLEPDINIKHNIKIADDTLESFNKEDIEITNDEIEADFYDDIIITEDDVESYIKEAVVMVEDIDVSESYNNNSPGNVNQENDIEYYNEEDVVNLVENVAMLENTSIMDSPKNINQQETRNNSFTTNPCETESARYIAKCRRINRKK